MLLAIPLSLAPSIVSPERAAAVTGSFDPGYIITDTLFYDGNAMTTGEIQAFLDAKIGSCLTDGCLNVAVVPFTTRAASYSRSGNFLCGEVAGGSLRVSELIYRTQVACGISAKVILVTLQKEQGLVTSRAPSDGALRAAMGMGCPDSGGCQSAFAGLGVQIYTGTKQLKTYKADQFGRQPGNNYIQYHPDSGCGGTTLFIRNYATAALYNYTPYQPNLAALNNLYGTGDGCSSYGNRNFWRYYSDWFGNPMDIIPIGVTVARLWGADRYTSAAAVSSASFASGVPVAYIASGADFADALSAAPAAAHGGGPVLLVAPDSIPSVIANELRRLAPQRIVIVGGTGAVSAVVAQQLAQFAPQIDRVSGANRYDTSRAIVSYAFGASVGEVYVATGSTFADALSASAAAGSRNDPVILVDGSQPGLDAATRDLLQSIGATKAYISGGTGVVSPGIEQGLAGVVTTVTRLAGSDRYATSNAVNTERFATASTFYVASGEAFPDALAAAPVAALAGAPLYVTQSSCMPRSLVQHIIDAGATRVIIVGGTGVVSSAAAGFRNC